MLYYFFYLYSYFVIEKCIILISCVSNKVLLTYLQLLRGLGLLTVAQGARVNQEQDARKTGAVLPSKGDQNINKPTPTDSAKTEQQLPKNKITLSSLRDFSLEPIFSR